MVMGQAMAEFEHLIPTLLELGLSNPVALHEVQARQVIYGGDLQLNLLELGVVSEQSLLSVLAQMTDLPACPPGPLLLDLDLTIRLRSSGVSGVAGAREDGVVIVAVNNRLPVTAQQLGQLLGEPCEIMLTTTVRLQEALHLFNGEDLPKRLTKLIDKLGKRLSLSQLGEPPRDVPRAHDVPTVALPHVAPAPKLAADSTLRHAPVETKSLSLSEAQVVQDDTAPPPVGYEHVTAFSGGPSKVSGTQSVPPPAAYSLSAATNDLAQATTRERLVEVLLRYSAVHFQYVAVFAIAGSEARGLSSAGQGSTTEEMKRLVVPLDLSSSFKNAVASDHGYVGRLRASGVEGGVARDLGRPVGLNVLLQPISIQQRPVLLLWCDNGMSAIAAEERSALEQVAPHVATGLKRVLMERKRATRGPQMSAHAAFAPTTDPIQPSRARTSSAPVRAQQQVPAQEIVPPPAAPLAHDPPVHHPPVHHPPVHDPPVSDPIEEAGPLRSHPTKIGLATVSRDRLLNSRNEAIAATRRNSAAPPPNSLPPAGTVTSDAIKKTSVVPAATHEVAAPARRPLTQPGVSGQHADRSSDPPLSFPPEPARTLKGFPASQRPDELAPSPAFEHTPKDPLHRVPLASRRIVALGRNLDSDEPPTHKLGDQELDVIEMSTTGTMLSRRPILPDAAPSDPASEHAPAPEVSADDQQLRRPKSFTYLVAELLKGNESVLPQLLDGGETAVGALIAEFPGPVTEPSSPSQKGSECGPILSALVGIGGKSIPFITVRTADENPRVRRWATFLLGELPGKESAKAVASRLLDSSIEVRRAALASSRRMRRDALTRRTLRAHVEQMCRDQGLDADARCSAIEALADIREHESIPVLLQLLEDFSPNVTRSARWALCVLTRQDFGDDLDAWRQFWQQHRDEDRVEWLIASLDHERRDIRRAAGDELRALCGKDFGYDEDQSQPDRRNAQADFRRWWHETGKANLH